MNDDLETIQKDKTKRDKTKLTGLEKVSIIMLSLPEEQVTTIFARLDPDELKEITHSMVSLGKVNPTLVENTYIEFIHEISSTGSLVGSIESTERLLSKVLSKDQADTIMEEIRGPAGRTLWDKLSNVNEEMLANYLKNEYPQTIAVILTRIRPENAAKILVCLPTQLSAEVIERILRMDTVKKEIIQDIENNLRGEFMSNLTRGSRRDNHETVAELFNSLDRTNEQVFMERLESVNPDSAERVRSLMFTFEDLRIVNSTDMQQIIKGLDKSKMGLALKGASEELRTLFFSSMATRAAKLLRDEMQQMGSVRVRDVEEAQSYIVGVAKGLANDGTINIAQSSDASDQMIE